MEKEQRIKNGYIILFYSIIWLIATINMIIISRSLADYKFFVGDKLRYLSLQESFMSLFTYTKQRQIFFLLAGSISIMIFYLLYLKISKPKKFESGIVEITPDIRIPAPVGQGQFGSKWFMKDIHDLAHQELGFFDKLFGKKKKEVFKHNIINFNDKRIQELISTGENDIKERFDRLQKLNDDSEAKMIEIDKIKAEIKQERLNQSGLLQDKKDEEQFIQQFGTEDYNGFIQEGQEITEEEIIESLDIIGNTSNEFDASEYENEIELQEEYLNQKYVNQIKEKNDKELQYQKSYNPKLDKNKIFKEGGLIIGVYDNRKKKKVSLFKNIAAIFILLFALSKPANINNNSEDVFFINKDTHSVIIGATRSGKSRCIVMESIGNTLLAGESIVVTDPKGELFAYTSEFAKKLGYEVICLDFTNANLSSKYNLLQPIINAKNDRTEEHPNGDIELIVKYSEELANMMLKESKGENPMWISNARSMIVGAILSLVLENDDEEIQNISNVYRFINDGEGKDISMLKDNLYLYIKALQLIKPESPIINQLLGIINTPPETRGGFSTNASSATRLFTQPSIWQITHKSNVDLSKMGERKQILYFILPDQDKSYYKIVSIIVKQMYNELVKVSSRYGNRLPIRVNFFLDEFGNFAPMPDLDAMLTVAGGRGMRFNLFIQGFPQITKVYDKETTEIVKSNCETWIYLKANDTTTLDEISKKIGSYTMYSNSESVNIQSGTTSSSSSSQSLQKRSLLLPEEVGKIARPYILVMNGENDPAVTKAPDLSQTAFNKMYGMGDEKYNENLTIIRTLQRPILRDEEEPKYWSLFQDLKEYCNTKIDKTHDSEGNEHEPMEPNPDVYITHIAQYLQNKDNNNLMVA